MYVCVLKVSVWRVRVHWVRTRALTVWRESHAPSTAVQWSQEELLRNVTAIRDGTAQTPAATAPLRRPEPLNTNGLLLEYKEAFYLLFITTSGNTNYQAFVYLSQRLRMTHQKSTIHPYVCAAADFTLLSPVGNAWRYSFLQTYLTDAYFLFCLNMLRAIGLYGK